MTEPTSLLVDEIRLESRWIGPGPDEAPTLVFLHEGLGCAGLWRDFPDRLARATGMGALVYSRRGYGASDPVPLPRPLDYMQREGLALDKVLDAAGIRRAVLVGHSDGASIALVHAGATPAARVLGVVAMAPHTFVEAVCLESIAAARDAFEQGGLRERLERHHGANVDCAFRGWNDAWLDPGFAAWEIRPLLAGIRVPVLVVQGEGDEYGTPRQVEAVADGVPGGARVIMLPDCGHSPHRDQPDATLEGVAAFARGLVSD